MKQYEASLRAMHKLLSRVEESHWANWIEKDIKDWQQNKDVSHHLSAYGGMGSFNDVVLCKANTHNIAENLEPFANTLFDWLKALCLFFSKDPDQVYEAEELKKQVGYHDASLSAFVGGDSAPDSMRGLFEIGQQLSGLRCLSCGYAEIFQGSIDTFVLRILLPPLVFAASENNALESLIEDVLNKKIDQYKELNEATHEGLSAAGIKLTNDDWNWNCPSCKKKDTAVYRWDIVSIKPLRFSPSDDNLEMR